jgi:hypothetical protein
MISGKRTEARGVCALIMMPLLWVVVWVGDGLTGNALAAERKITTINTYEKCIQFNRRGLNQLDCSKFLKKKNTTSKTKKKPSGATTVTRPSVPKKSTPPKARIEFPKSGPIPDRFPGSLQRPPSEFLSADSVISPGAENTGFLNYDPQYGISHAEHRAMGLLIEQMQKDGIDKEIAYDPKYGVSQGSFEGILRELNSQAERLRNTPPVLSTAEKDNLDTVNQYFQAATWIGVGTAVGAGTAVTIVSAPVIVASGVVISLAGGAYIEYAKMTGENITEEYKLKSSLKKAATGTVWNMVTAGMGNVLFPGIPNPVAEMALEAGLVDTWKNANRKLENYAKSLESKAPSMAINPVQDRIEVYWGHAAVGGGGGGINVSFSDALPR